MIDCGKHEKAKLVELLRGFFDYKVMAVGAFHNNFAMYDKANISIQIL